MAFFDLQDNMTLAEAFIKRIIRDALSVDDIIADVNDAVTAEPRQVVGISSVATRSTARLEPGALPPFDLEAT